MFSLMGNCVSCIKKRREPKRPITLAILGLDCAGKTTAARGLTGEPLDDDIAPTVGFNSEKFTLGKFDITMYDLGGGKQIRGVWTTYLPEVYGIVYMIDSTAADRMEELKDNFRQLVENGKIAGKPILVLANKQDKENALDEVDICEQLMLEHTVNIYKCPCRVESCSAIRGTGRKMDPTIKEGMQWLCDVIEKHFDSLKSRVDEDMAEAEAARKIEAAARKERVRKIREKREQDEEEERKKQGIEAKPESDEEDFVDGNPFKPVDVEELKRKEAKAKEEKKKKKELQSKTESEVSMTKTDRLDEADYLQTPRSNRGYGLPPLGHDLGEKSADDSDDIVSSSRSRRILPPLQQPLGTKFMEESTTTKKKKKKKVKQHNAYTENEINGFGSPHLEDASTLESQEQKTMRSVSKISVTTKSLGDGSEDILPLSSHRLTPLDGEDDVITPKGGKRTKKKKVIDDLTHNNSAFELHDASELIPAPRPLPQRNPSLDIPDQDGMSPGRDLKKMKKKKKPRRNQLSPSGHNEEEDVLPSTRGGHSSRSYPWDTPSQLMDRSDQDDVRPSHQTSDFSTKWGLAEDLPQVADSVIRNKPNYDDDDDVVL